MKSSWFKSIGPGPLIAAAFIGPGTVTVCTLAGVHHGYDLLWALGLSVVTTVVLQEISARIGLATGKGLATVLSEKLPKGLIRVFSIVLILMAIVIGNAAYEAGNLSGAVLGLELVVPFDDRQLNLPSFQWGTFLIGIIALALLWTGSYQSITKTLTILVVLMGLAFLVSAFWVQAPWKAIMSGFIPNLNQGNILTVVALIGTTVVPYNLFLHSSLVAKKWSDSKDLGTIRKETLVSVGLGGIVSMAIVITAAAGSASEVQSAYDLAKGLEPIMGKWANYFISFGLFAAGITSAITAPLAGALVVSGLFGLSTELRSKPMRLSIFFILGLGMTFSSLGIKPVQLIQFAQVANGILLPLISAYIIWLVNQKQVMKEMVNHKLLNIISLSIWLITFTLGLISLAKVFGLV